MEKVRCFQFRNSFHSSLQLGCFKSKSPQQFEEEELVQGDTSPAPTKKSLNQSEIECKMDYHLEEKSLLDDNNGDIPNSLE